MINQCDNSPCQNDGTCQPLIDSYQCHCLAGYQGKNCEEKITKSCFTNFCLYVSYDFIQRLIYIEEFICRNNSTCTVTANNDFHCACLSGYAGRKCEVEIDACNSNPCHSGTCHSIRNGFYSCSCSPDYTGFNCEIKQNSCNSFPCLNRGVCNEISPNTFNCNCSNGYFGSQCQYGGYQCYSGPCLNNGTCLINENNYQCVCPKGLTGHRCEIDINECVSMPCQNNGICLQSQLNAYECHCLTSKY